MLDDDTVGTRPAVCGVCGCVGACQSGVCVVCVCRLWWGSSCRALDTVHCRKATTIQATDTWGRMALQKDNVNILFYVQAITW